jgi:hypothetical protein
MPYRILTLCLCFWAASSISSADSGRSIEWSQLSQIVTPRHLIQVVLPDGVTVQAIAKSFSDESAVVYVTKTSNKKLHPKGDMTIPRSQMRAVGIRAPRSRGRWIATLSPLALSLVFFTVASQDVSEGTFYGSLAAGTLAMMSVPPMYFVGRAADRRFDRYTITGP